MRVGDVTGIRVMKLGKVVTPHAVSRGMAYVYYLEWGQRGSAGLEERSKLGKIVRRFRVPRSVGMKPGCAWFYVRISARIHSKITLFSSNIIHRECGRSRVGISLGLYHHRT